MLAYVMLVQEVEYKQKIWYFVQCLHYRKVHPASKEKSKRQKTKKKCIVLHVCNLCKVCVIYVSRYRNESAGRPNIAFGKNI